MQWALENSDMLLRLTGLHLFQAVVPLVLGVLIAVPLAWLARSRRSVGGALMAGSAIMYTVPSLALFVLLPVLLGTKILDITNVIVALTLYAVALLVRSTVDALNSVDNDVRQAATAMGYRPLRRFLAVDLPLSLPVLIAGLRVISVSNMSLVSVGSLLGIESLGRLFMDGLFRSFPTEIAVGIVLILALALLLDLLLVGLQRLLTPWTRLGRAGTATLAARVRAGAA